MSVDENFTVRRKTTNLIYENPESGELSDIDGPLNPIMGQGPAVQVSIDDDGVIEVIRDDDYARDEVGFTNPNFHRRVDPKEPEISENILNQEVDPREYKLNLMGTNSYRTTIINVHDEESVVSEIP